MGRAARAKEKTPTELPKLTREAFLAAQDLPEEIVQIDGLGVLTVRGLTGKQRDDYEASCVMQKGNKRSFNIRDARAKLVALSVIGDDGKRMFTNADIATLSTLPAKHLDKVFEVAQRLSGISDDDIAELGKLSDDDLGESSSSDLPNDSED